MASVAVLVLAGGRSRRMGTNKAGLSWQGRTLLDWQKSRLAGLGWPVPHSGPGGIADRTPGYPGPLGGLQAALVAEPGIDIWVMLPVDMPTVRPDSLRHLALEAQRLHAPTAYRDCPLPMAVPVVDSLGAVLDGWLADPDGPRSLFRLHQHHRGRWLEPPADPDELVNLNTPEDWQWFQQHAGQLTGEHNE